MRFGILPIPRFRFFNPIPINSTGGNIVIDIILSTFSSWYDMIYFEDYFWRSTPPILAFETISLEYLES